MNIKNTVSLTVDEAVTLLSKITKSLESKHEFAFDLKGQEVSIDVGPELIAKLNIKPEEFSIVFNWDESSVKEIQQEEKQTKVPDKPAQEQTQTAQSGAQQPAQSQVSSQEAAAVISADFTRSLPERQMLNTSTLPLDAGYWAPAFTADDEVVWSPIDIDGELENKKWATDDQITSLSDLTPSKAKPRQKRSKPGADDDLFSELDKMDEDPSSTPRRSKPEPTQSIPKNRTSASPAGAASNIPSPGGLSSPPPQAGTQPSGGTPDDTWTSPQPKTSNDDWVKPSEHEKEKNKSIPSPSGGGSSKSGSIPAPSRTPPTPTSSGGSSSGPSGPSGPSGTSESSNAGIPKPKSTSGIPQPKRSSSPSAKDVKQEEVDPDVQGWKEPSREENVSDDDWVKPSEFLKRSGSKKKKKDDDKINRPPPKAPDADDDDDKKKGWASWD